MPNAPSIDAFEKRGPYRVGLRELMLPSAAAKDRLLPTAVWYPALAEPQGPDDAPHPYGQTHRASLEIAPIDVDFPLILFSHGNSGSRHQSTFLTTHLASWGHVVAAPDHLGNNMEESRYRRTESELREAHVKARQNRPLDLLGVLRALLDEGPLPNLPSLLPERVGVCGHSFGGWTALKIPALDARVRAVCSLAPVSESFVGRNAFSAGELPLSRDLETLLVAAKDDVLVDLETGILPLHERLGAHTQLEIMNGADHFHFCDGIALLHELHENTPREHSIRPIRPFDELEGEAETHAFLNRSVTQFFNASLTP